MTRETTDIEKKKARNKYVTKVKRFSRSKAGLAYIRTIAPEIADIIEENPKVLDIPQWVNGEYAGNYIFDIWEKPYNTGESGNVVFRCCEHLYNYKTTDAFGGQYDKKVPARFKVFAWHVSHKEHRELIEAAVIQKLKPVIQYTPEDAPEYGVDKPIPEGETRESMRPDICIFQELRVKRYEQDKREYEEKHRKQKK